MYDPNPFLNNTLLTYSVVSDINEMYVSVCSFYLFISIIFNYTKLKILEPVAAIVKSKSLTRITVIVLLEI